MKINLVSGGWFRNSPWGTEFAFKKGLERLGHSAIPVLDADEHPGLDMSADATVVFKYVKSKSLLNDLVNFTGPKLVYQPDDMRFSHIQEEMKFMSRFCPNAALFERDGMNFAEHLGFKRTTRITLPVDNDIYRPSPQPKILDFCFIGNISNEPCHASRRKMVDIVLAAGFRGFALSTFNVSEIVRIYNSSKVVIHHATDVGQPFGYGYGFQSRHFEAGFTGAAVLSNTVINEEWLPGLCYFDDEETLISQLNSLVKEGLYTLSGKMYKEYLDTHHLPQHRAQDLLDFIGECV